jgi:hypothetical protein
MKTTIFKNSIKPELSPSSNAKPLHNALILRNLLGGVSERRVLRDQRQQRKNSKERYYPRVYEFAS